MARREGKGREEKLSVPYKLINLGANNCPAWFRESQIGGVDLAVFRGHAFSATIRQCVCPDRGTAITPVNGSFLWLLARVCWHICKLLVTNYSSGSSLLSSSSISPTGRRSSFRQASALALLNFLLPAKIVQIRDNFKFYTGLETVENSNYDNKREMRNRLRMFLRKYIKK